ncbi:hypothetical protein UPYG_G00067060 [Umbra pygmaea]|uniref:Uncharacterized protein n=1 Tax=Umbra pygmaea TaxID=75934 RepID=A0ABD0XSG9_UMBPY
MLMATEKDVLVALDTDTVIDRVAEKSEATEETAVIDDLIIVVHCFEGVQRAMQPFPLSVQRAMQPFPLILSI